jgi:hypothetical protein
MSFHTWRWTPLAFHTWREDYDSGKDPGGVGILVSDQEDIRRMLRSNGLVTHGLEPLPEELLVSHCIICKRQTYRSGYHKGREVIICSTCEKTVSPPPPKPKKPQPQPIVAEPEVPAPVSPDLKLYWLSWFQPTEGYQPQTDPPPRPLCGWWYAGPSWRLREENDGLHVLCACVLAATPEAAEGAILRSWPEAAKPPGKWRFCQEKSLGWRPASAAFPIREDWEKERFDAIRRFHEFR